MSIKSKVEEVKKKVENKIEAEVKKSIFKNVKAKAQEVTGKVFEIIEGFIDLIRKIPLLKNVVNFVIEKAAPEIIVDDKVKLWAWIQQVLAKKDK
ncbi:MAG: hypothetical protein [Caudoviricetes sp.]|nr:MAG: hypothetical protein [Caudoviricetes sp.]